jgi:hypothetical protein
MMSAIGTTTLFVRRFLADYTRNPVNLLVGVLVPLVFVIVAGGSRADAAKLLGGTDSSAEVQTVTAGWAAGFVAAIAMYFQVAAAREVDRRLIVSGLGTARLVAARLAAGLTMALLASAAALLALQVRGGIGQPGRVTAGALMLAVIYMAVGAACGTLVRNPVNGTVLILFLWILDVFFGPTMSPDKPATRVLPTHFVSLCMVDLPSHHGGRLGDLGWALAWTRAAAALAWTVVAATSRVAHQPRWRVRRGSVGDQQLVLAGLRAGVVLAARLAVIGLAGALATAASLAVAAAVFDARQWPLYAAANLLIAVTYGLLGVLLGSVFRRVGGVFVAFLVPFLDLGIAQSPMLRADPAAWATSLPGYGGMRVLLDGGLTATFDQTRALLIAALWLVGLIAATTVLFRHTMLGQHRRP